MFNCVAIELIRIEQWSDTHTHTHDMSWCGFAIFLKYRFVSCRSLGLLWCSLFIKEWGSAWPLLLNNTVQFRTQTLGWGNGSELRAFLVLAEDWHLVTCIHVSGLIASHNSSSKGSNVLFWPLCALVYRWYTQAHVWMRAHKSKGKHISLKNVKLLN